MLTGKIFVILMIFLCFPVVGFSDENDSTNFDEVYSLYYKNPSLKDSVINSLKKSMVGVNQPVKQEIILGSIYMNEMEFDSAIVYFKNVIDNSLNINNGLKIYPGVALHLLEAYRYTFRFKEIGKLYSVYWAFLQSGKYKDKLMEFDENLTKNIRWWHIDFSRQVAEKEFGEKHELYAFGFVNSANYESVSKDVDVSRLIQNKNDTSEWATVMMMPLKDPAEYFYCFYFNDYELVSYVKIPKAEFADSKKCTKEEISKNIKSLDKHVFEKDKSNLLWHTATVTLDNDEPFEVLILDK